MDRRLVDHFVNANLISRAGMQRFILRATKNKTGVIEEILTDGSLDQQVVARGVADCYGYELLPDAAIDAEPVAINMISGKMAKAHGVLPFAVSDGGDHVTVAVYDTQSADEVLKTLKMATGNEAEVKVATRSLLEDAIDHYYFDEPWPLKDESLKDESADADEAPEFHLEKIEESDEFLLEDIAEEVDALDRSAPGPAPDTETAKQSARKKAPAQRPETRKQPFARVEPEKVAVRKARAPGPPANKHRDKQDSVEQALDEFDDFLDQSDYVSGAPGISNDPTPQNPEWDADDHMAAQSGFEVGAGFDAGDVSDESFEDPGIEAFDEDAFANAFNDEPNASGFDLFEPSEVQMPLEELVARNEKRIQNLKRELKGQREVVSSLVDLLVESRVISRKELMQRVGEKRKS